MRRALDRLTSIRAKLGSTVVIAVALALAISYVLIAFASATRRDSEAIDASASRGRSRPGGSTLLPRHDDRDPASRRQHRDARTRLGELPRLQVDTPRWGVIGAHLRDGPDLRRRLGHRADPVAVARPPRSAVGDDRFLQSVWWQFLLVGVVAATVSLSWLG